MVRVTAISCPLWSSVYECQRVECAFTSPMRTECGMLVMTRTSLGQRGGRLCKAHEHICMQCCMSVLTSRGIYIFVMAICLVLLMCTLTI